MVRSFMSLGGAGGTPQSRRGVCDQSRVTMSAFAPAARAASTRASISALVPTQ